MKSKTVSFILFFLTVIFVSSAFSQRREAQPVSLKKISDNLYEILGGSGANGGLYIGNNGVLVIDAKMNKESVDQVLAEIKKITDKHVKYLVNTHSDGDHITGNRFFPETVTFVAHENCRDDFFRPKRDGSASDWAKEELAPFVPSLTFTDKMDIYLGNKKVELWYFGIGHTTGDIVAYFPEEKVAFLGDQLFMTRPQLIHSYKGGNSFEHIKTLEKMLNTIDAVHFCSGHSEMVGRDEIRSRMLYVKNFQDKIKKLVNENKTLEEVKAEFEENEARLVTAIYNEVKN